MDKPEVFGLKESEKTVYTMERNMMVQTVRPRRNNAWAMYKRQQIKISGNFGK
jgi:hypothetical protein